MKEIDLIDDYGRRYRIKNYKKFKNHILKLEKANEMIVDKYEDKYEEYEKANDDLKKQNTELTLNVEELKERLFGKLTMRLKEFATRPDKKKDN